jgi:hypothetical protein
MDINIKGKSYFGLNRSRGCAPAPLEPKSLCAIGSPSGVRAEHCPPLVRINRALRFEAIGCSRRVILPRPFADLNITFYPKSMALRTTGEGPRPARKGGAGGAQLQKRTPDMSILRNLTSIKNKEIK